MTDLDVLDIGLIFDMVIESANDSCEYKYKATQADFDKF